MKIKTFVEFVFSVFIILSLIGNTNAIENTTVNATIGNVTTLNPGNFLETEAGISAYTKATTTINLNYAKNACRTGPEVQTTNYFICSVPVWSGSIQFPESEDAHVYVGKSGWILAYYMREEPVNKIMQWNGYSGQSTFTTTLADTISSIANAAGVSYSGLKYYDFKYPMANRLAMIVDWKFGPGDTDTYDSYQFKIPMSFALNENSWSYRNGGIRSADWNSWEWKKIDGQDFPSPYGSYTVNGMNIYYGYYGAPLTRDVYHNVNYASRNYGDTGINTALVYTQP